MRIEVCHVGATKEKWIRNGEDFYISKCKRFTKIQTKIVRSTRVSDPARAREEDARNLLDYIKQAPKAFNVLLDERGKALDSPAFARFIEHKLMHFGGSVRFITGGPFGVSDEFRDASDEMLALSSMVFTHEMVRVVLLEQLYRAFTILRGESYHHI